MVTSHFFSHSVKTVCRLCDKGLSSKTDFAHKSLLRLELLAVKFETNNRRGLRGGNLSLVDLLSLSATTVSNPRKLNMINRKVVSTSKRPQCIKKARDRPSKQVKENLTAKAR